MGIIGFEYLDQLRGRLTSFILVFVLLGSCTFSANEPESTSQPVSHELFNQLLQKHVSEDGRVSYTGFIADSVKLKAYLKLLSASHPNDTWTEKERLAYWINAYNAFTIQLILNHWPLESIKDIGSRIQLPFINSPWDIKFIRIEDMEYDLNNIEHSILRKEFKEPRIHFAIVCASYSCPRLLNQAFVADKLESQLEAQARDFINDPRKNQLSAKRIGLSKIFSWFQGDFTDEGSLIQFLNNYANITIAEDAEIAYREYDWQLND